MTTVWTSAAVALMSLAIGCGSHSTARGMLDRKLAPCPSAPHCVSTQGARPGVPPVPYLARDDARQRLVAIIRSMPGARVITESPDYIRAEFTSRLFKYVDDVEVYLDDREKLAHFRSSSRTGFYDFGANRRRVKKIREKFVAEKS